MADVAFAIEQVKRVRYYIEPNTDYAVDASGTETFKDVRTTAADMAVNEPMLDNNTMQHTIDAAQPKIRSGQRRCSLSLGSYLVSHNVDVAGATDPVDSSQSDLIGTIMGGIVYTTGSAVGLNIVDNGSFDGSTSDDKLAGTAVGLVDPNTGRMEVARVKSFSGSDEILLEHKLPFTPGVAATINGGTHCHFTDDPDRSLQFIVQGQDNQDSWVLQGLQGAFSLTYANGELATVTYDLTDGADWSYGTTAGIQEATFTTSDPIPVVDARVLFYPVGGDALTSGEYVSVDASSWEITPNISYKNVTTPKGVGNILRKRRERSVPAASGTVTGYFHDRSFFDARSADTRYGLAVQIGSAPGKTVYVSVPYVQIVDVQRADVDGLAGVTVSYEALDNKHGTEGSNRELAKSAFSVHFL